MKLPISLFSLADGVEFKQIVKRVNEYCQSEKNLFS